MGGRWRYKLTASLKFAKSVPYKDTKFKGGRWRYKLTASLKFAKSVPYKDTKFMGARWRYKLTASLKCAKSVPYKDTKFMGGRWRYKLTASLKFAKSVPYTDTFIQPAGSVNSTVDVGVTNLGCKLKFAKSTIQKTQKIEGGCWRCKLTTFFKIAKSTIRRNKNSGATSAELLRRSLGLCSLSRGLNGECRCVADPRLHKTATFA